MSTSPTEGLQDMINNLSSDSPLVPGGNLSIDIARDFMLQHDLQGVVIFAIQKDGVIQTLTYGENKRKCSVLSTWRDGFMRVLSRVPFCTVFGWGNNGVPVKLTQEEKLHCKRSNIPKDWY